jgi:hypothetical protein
MKVIIDRFEGEYAIVELPDQTFIDVPRVLFGNAKEGDVINIIIDSGETNIRKKRVDDLFKSLLSD